MRLKYTLILLITLALGLSAQAGEQADTAAAAPVPHDTVQVYCSWQAVLNHEPDTVAIDPKIQVNSPFDFSIEAQGKGSKPLKRILKQQAVAVTIGDSLWLMSSDWIKHNFKGDCGAFSRFVPLYFNSKVAFVQFRRNNATIGGALLNSLVTGLTGIDFGVGMGDGYNGRPPKFYLLDFGEGRVRVVDHDLLLSLLDRYPDMKRGYMGRKDAEKTPMVNEYFMMWVDRISADPSVADQF